MKNSSLVILNTLISYTKIVIVALFSFFSARFVLASLGEVDYGIYTVVAGLTVMAAFFRIASASSSNRFFGIELGKSNINGLKEVFNNSIIIHLVVVLIFISLAQTLGVWFFNNHLTIPQDRYSDAFLVYQITIVGMVFEILSIPFFSVLYAREKINLVALLNIFQAFFLFLLAVVIYYDKTAQIDLLVFYSIGKAVVFLLTLLIIGVYCGFKFPECSFGLKVNRVLLKSMVLYSGWTFFGSIAVITRIQGCNILINMFFGPVVNASYGVANQVNSQLLNFSTSLSVAINPQIIKNEGAMDRKKQLWLSQISSRYSFFVLCFFALPVIFEMDFLFGIWLKHVPEYAVLFCRFLLLIGIIDRLTDGIVISVAAIGKIAIYHIVTGSLLILNVVFGFIAFNLGYPPEAIFILGVVISIVLGITRTIFLKKIAGAPFRDWFIRVILKCIVTVLPSLGVCVAISYLLEGSVIRLIITILCSSALMLLSVWKIGMYEDEKVIFGNLLVKVKKMVRG